jgi:uncharacterized protein YabN with tetrapyrrole methylase and pyrophosphatase domain
MGFNSEEALSAANRKFMTRFSRVEKLADGRSLAELSAEELEGLWAAAKSAEK